MFTNEELVRNNGYWLDQIQNELHFELKNFMTSNSLNRTELANELGFSKGYISQVLNGNFNFSLMKLIDLSLAINKVPRIEFVDVSRELAKLDKLNSVKVIDMGVQEIAFDTNWSSRESNYV